MATRYDVSAVPPQGGYVAKQCPVRAQWDALEPCDPLPHPAALERRLARGREFEAQIVAELARHHPGATILAHQTRTARTSTARTGTAGPDSRAEREAATLSRHRGGRRVIIGGRLPADLAGRRVGEPDLLVTAAGSGYRAVDIKHHRSLDAADGAGPGALCSALDALTLESAYPTRPSRPAGAAATCCS